MQVPARYLPLLSGRCCTFVLPALPGINSSSFCLHLILPSVLTLNVRFICLSHMWLFPLYVPSINLCMIIYVLSYLCCYLLLLLGTHPSSFLFDTSFPSPFVQTDISLCLQTSVLVSPKPYLQAAQYLVVGLDSACGKKFAARQLGDST